MEDNLTDLVNILTTTIFSDEILAKITNVLRGVNTKFSTKFLAENFSPLHTLEHWVWKLLSEDPSKWSMNPNYYEFFENLAFFNKNLIFIWDDTDADTKAALLIPSSNDMINSIFSQIEKNQDENDLYFLIISLWFDNLSYFIQEHTQFIRSSIIIEINHSIATKFVLTEQYKSYLTQLQQSPLAFTNKQLFFLKTCSFTLSSFFVCKAQTFPFTGDEILRFIGKDYLEILCLHGYTVQLWSQELFCCITHLINFIHACCLWRGDREKNLQILLSSDDIAHNYVQLLIHIISHKSFHQQVESYRCNDATILIDSILTFITYILESHDLVYFIRKRTRLVETLLLLAETPGYSMININAYAMLGELLCDDGLKQLKVTDHLCGYFFYVLEHAWNHPAQMYRRATVQRLLRGNSIVYLKSDRKNGGFVLGFLVLAKNDSIQQRTANANKIPLLVEMSDRYPVIYDILWGLSFNHDIQEQLHSNPKFMFNISHLKNDMNNEQMRKIVHGILWNLECNHDDHLSCADGHEPMFDIMISYSHKDKVLCRKIYDQLIKTGFRVWIDFDQMHGNVMDAMAQAIEQSKTVVICMSEQYRRSNYCRAEAYYAFQRQLKLIPVLLQEHYHPDGWLLFLVGQLFYVDFIKHDFSQAMEVLLKEISTTPVDDGIIVPDQSAHGKDMILSSLPLPLPLPGSTSFIASKNILDWAEGEVHEWLIQNNLTQMAHLLTNYDGASLVCLKKYLTDGGVEQVMRLLENDSQRRMNRSLSLLELVRFQTLLEREVTASANSKGATETTEKKRKKTSLNCCKIM